MLQRHKKPLPTINELPRGDQMPKKTSSAKTPSAKTPSAAHQEAERRIKKLSDDLGITTHQYHTCNKHDAYDNDNKAGTPSRSRANSRGRGNHSETSSRAPSSERGVRSKKDIAYAKYQNALKQYKFAKDWMEPHRRADFLATAVMLTENDEKMSVMDYLKEHPKVPEKYYTLLKTTWPTWEDTPFEYKANSTKSVYKYHIDRAMGDLRRAKIDYRDYMSKATMAALAIDKSHAPPEDQALSFQDYIKKHTTPKASSVQSVQEHFQAFSHVDMKVPGQSASSGVLDKPLQTKMFSSFSTEHFEEPVPDEYRV